MPFGETSLPARIQANIMSKPQEKTEQDQLMNSLLINILKYIRTISITFSINCLKLEVWLSTSTSWRIRLILLFIFWIMRISAIVSVFQALTAILLVFSLIISWCCNRLLMVLAFSIREVEPISPSFRLRRNPYLDFCPFQS